MKEPNKQLRILSKEALDSVQKVVNYCLDNYEDLDLEDVTYNKFKKAYGSMINANHDLENEG